MLPTAVMSHALHSVACDACLLPSALDFEIDAYANGESPIYMVMYGLPVQMDMFGVVSVVRPASPIAPGIGAPWVHRPLYVHQWDRADNMAKHVSLLFTCSSSSSLLSRLALRHGVWGFSWLHAGLAVVLVLIITIVSVCMVYTNRRNCCA
jgi:hypothetical protein